MQIQELRAGLLSQMPEKFQKLLLHIDFSELQEIRMRLKRPIMLYFSSETAFLAPDGGLTQKASEGLCCGSGDLERLVAAFCGHSVYAFQNEIRDGFITLRGGHRVGISGRAVAAGERIETISGYSGLNIRLAREYPGCAKILMPYLVSKTGPQNALLISPPQCGKTTMLRDIARTLGKERKVTVVDERSELAAMRPEGAQLDVGLQTDVLDRFPKAAGMLLAVRSLSPEVIITDEIGGAEDIAAMRSVLGAGCKIITSIHGYDVESIRRTKGELLSLFDVALVLGRQAGKPSLLHTWQKE